MVKVGSIVSLKVDRRDRSHANPLGLLGVVYAMKSHPLQSVKVVTEHGVLCSGVEKSCRWIPPDQYLVQSENTTLTPKLKNFKEAIMKSEFNEALIEKKSTKQAHLNMTGNKHAHGRQRCKCKKGNCTKRCGCRKNNRHTCTSACSCSGNCNWSKLREHLESTDTE